MSNVCNSAYQIGSYASSYVINPCNVAGSIGTYDNTGCSGCCNGIEEDCGNFTGTTATINPGNIFSGDAFVAGIFELFLKTVNQVSSNPVRVGDPQYKGAYYYYYINSPVSKLNVITAQGALNTSSLIQAVDTTQINFTTGVGILINLNIPCYVGWKFTRSK